MSDTSSSRPSPIDLAARALHHRDRSSRQLDDRLARAGIADDARAETLERLERLGYVDDTRYAAGRAAALAARGYGDEAIRHALAEAGVADEQATEALAALDPESERARLLVDRLGATAKILVDRLGATAKTLAALRRKGFSEDTLDSIGSFAEGDARA